MDRMCSHTDCMNKATHRVVLEMKGHPKDAPATGKSELVVCGEHADVKWEDFVSEEGWNAICDSFLANGFRKPVKKHSRLKVIPI